MRVNLNGKPEPLRLYMLDLSTKWMDRCLPAHFQQLHQFYKWLKMRGYQIETFTLAALGEYHQVLEGKTLAASTRQTFYRTLLRHFTFLHEKGLCQIDPKQIPGPSLRAEYEPLNVTLPKIAEEFLATLPSHKKPASCENYLRTLRHLYACLGKENIDITDFGEKEYGIFLDYLSKRKIFIAGRHGHMALARVYLRWLYDRELVKQDPDRAMRRVILPKIPDTLPRPLAPDVDKLFQEAFLEASDNDTRGLYVMRHSGTRIGELSNLAFDCMRHDMNGHTFLKIPLGKLNNERLVPLMPKTMDVIKQIQSSAVARTLPGMQPEWLFLDKRGRHLKRSFFHVAFRDIKHRLIVAGKLTETAKEPIVPHRLRHTFATEMLTGGMSLVAVKDLLGHHAIRMTLRYAAVVPTKVIEEYFAAIKVLAMEHDFAPTSELGTTLMLGYRKLLSDLVFLLKKRAADASAGKGHKIDSLIAKAEQLGREIARL